MSGAYDQNSNTFRTATDTFQPTDAGRSIAIAGAGGGGGNLLTTVGQVVDARTITTNDNPSTTGVSTQFGFLYGYTAVNFGVLVRKKTASSDTIAIDYASVNYNLDIVSAFTDEGGLEFCSKGSVIGPNGRPGYNCLISGSNFMYWIDASSAETHFMGLPSAAPYYAGCGSESQGHDLNNPDILYCSASGTLYKFIYYGNHSEPTAINPAGSFGLDQTYRSCNTQIEKAPYTSQQPCIVVQVLTPNTDIIALTGAFTQNPAYAPAMDTVNFRTLIFRTVDENGDLVFTSTRGTDDTLGWSMVYRPSATSNSEGGSSTGPLNNHGCLGGGLPGCIIAAMPDWARPGCRWCVIKDALSPYPGWMSVQTYGWGCCSPGGGPYYVPVVDGTANGTKNYLDGSTTLINCPPNPFGATGQTCSMLTIGSEPVVAGLAARGRLDCPARWGMPRSETGSPPRFNCR